MGIRDAVQNDHGIVTATIDSNLGDSRPTVVLNAHLDTSPETSGTNVCPLVIDDYRGGNIELPGDKNVVIRVDENPELLNLVGKTLITSDGTTLLGADDKAGVAIIMEIAECLVVEGDMIPHGTVRLLFTCDEEIGRGVDHVDIAGLDADVCYTLDGPSAGHIDVETFSADMATIDIEGVNLHPAIAKNRMVNAVKIAAAIVDRLPPTLSPEATSHREGFVHPFSIEGGVARVQLRILLRDFDTDALSRQAQILRNVIEEITPRFPGAKIRLQTQPQYRNLGDGLKRDPRAVAFAQKAFQKLGYPSVRSIIRGGTDGSRMTELGLPTPNLSSGQHNPHSRTEWACLEEMEQAGQVTLELLRIWGESC